MDAVDSTCQSPRFTHTNYCLAEWQTPERLVATPSLISSCNRGRIHVESKLAVVGICFAWSNCVRVLTGCPTGYRQAKYGTVGTDCGRTFQTEAIISFGPFVSDPPACLSWRNY